MCETGGAEAVVDIHDPHTGRAGVEHRQQCSHSAETRSIPSARRDGNNRTVNKPPHDAGQDAVHSGNHDNDLRIKQAVFLPKKTMDARNANVVEALNMTPHHFSGDAGLFRDRDIGGAGGHHENVALRLLPCRMDRDKTCVRIVPRPTIEAANCPGDWGLRAGGEERTSLFDQGMSDRHDLFRGFSLAEHDFGKSLPQRSMVIKGRKPEIFKRERSQALEPLFDGQLSHVNLLK